MNIIPDKISSNKRQGFIHDHTWIKNQVSICFDYYSNIMILAQWISVQNKNPNIKNHLKHVVNDNEHQIID